jgi:hypothetical protein
MLLLLLAVVVVMVVLVPLLSHSITSDTTTTVTVTTITKLLHLLLLLPTHDLYSRQLATVWKFTQGVLSLRPRADDPPFVPTYDTYLWSMTAVSRTLAEL